MTQDASNRAARSGCEAKTASKMAENLAWPRADCALRRDSLLLERLAGQRRPVGPDRQRDALRRSFRPHLGRRD